MTKAIVTAERLRELISYNPETGVFTRLVGRRGGGKVGDIVGSINGSGYVRICVDYRSYQGHRLAWLYVHGVWPIDQIDHINGQRDDNRICNLRDVTRAQNMRNQRRPSVNNSSGFLGVSWSKEKLSWVAQITINGRTRSLGKYSDPAVAHQVYLKAKRELHPSCTI